MPVDISDILGGALYPLVKDMTSDGSSFDMYNKSVQFSADANNMASSESTFLFSGPPVLNPAVPFKNAFETYLEPLGAAQQYSLQQGGQIIPFSELGSKLKRHARGTGQYSASIAAVHTRHSDLKWRLYGWLSRFLNDTYSTTQLSLGMLPGANRTDSATNGFSIGRQMVGLESELFNIPFGLLCITGSAGGKVVHIEYLEDCVIQGSGTGLTAGNPMVVPNIQIQLNRPVAFIDSSGNTLLSGESLKALKNLKQDKTYTMAAPHYTGATKLAT